MQAIETALGTRPELSVAGRTDAGVHAWAQVVSFPADLDASEADELRRSLNGVLPQDVAVLEAEPMEASFDARHDSRSRTYCYRLLARPAPSPFELDRALWWPWPLDESSLEECSRALVGTHDFTAFTPAETEHSHFRSRVDSAEWLIDGDIVEFWIEADKFLRHMNRVLVGTMLDVAGGRRTFEEFTSLLDGRPRAHAGRTAPAHGLALAHVSYGGALVARPGRV